MQLSERHALTFEDLTLIVEALNTLSTDVESQGGEVLQTLKRIEDFAKEGCGRLILNLDTVEEPLGGMPQEVKNVGASLVGGVLVVTCQVTSREMLRVKVLTRHHPFPKQLISSFDVLFSSTASSIRTAISRMGKPRPN